MLTNKHNTNDKQNDKHNTNINNTIRYLICNKAFDCFERCIYFGCI